MNLLTLYLVLCSTQNPPLGWDTKTWVLYGDTMAQLGRLDEMTNKLPNLQCFIKAYVIKEALLSSAIEGVHTTFVEIFTQPFLKSKPKKEIQQIINYTKAFDTALSLIKKGLPISSQVLINAHETLMNLDDADQINVDHHRKLREKISLLIPATAPQIPGLMTELERFINTNKALPPLIKAGLAHIQFEAIHPFLNDNGRIGRLLLFLMLLNSGLLSVPILYPSHYFKKHHLEYCQWLDYTSTDGDFEKWIRFYLTAIRDSAIDAYRRAKEIEALSEHIAQRIVVKEASNMKKRESRLKALSILFNYPIISITELEQQLDMAYNTADQIISEFVELGFVIEETQQQRNKLYRFKPYLDILEREYD